MKNSQIEILKAKIMAHPLVEELNEDYRGNTYSCKLKDSETRQEYRNRIYYQDFTQTDEGKIRQLNELYKSLEIHWLDDYKESLKTYNEPEMPLSIREELTKLDKNSEMVKVVKFLINEIQQKEEEVNTMHYEASMADSD